MKIFRSLLALSCGVIAPLAFSADASSTAVVTQSSDSPRVVSIDFPGGPLSAFLSAINQDGAALNVVGEKTDLAIELPPVSLRNADSTALASALSTLLQSHGFLLQPPGMRSGGGQPVWVLRKLAPHEFQQMGLPQFQSFQLGQYLETQTVDDIIGAIRAAWELDPAHNAAALKLKFHPPTGILLVDAPNEGIAVVMSVLQQLRRNPEPKSAKAATAPPAPEKK